MGAKSAAAGAPLDLPAPAAATTVEADFYSTIVDGAHVHGWMAAHFRPARTKWGWRTAVQGDGAGFPDLILAHPRGGVLFIEVKHDRNRRPLAEAQATWGRVLTDAGARWCLLHVPSELPCLWEELEVGARGGRIDTSAPGYPLVAEVDRISRGKK